MVAVFTVSPSRKSSELRRIQPAAAIHVPGFGIGERGGVRVEDASVHHPSEHQLVIARSSSSLQIALEVGQRLLQNRSARPAWQGPNPFQLIKVAPGLRPEVPSQLQLALFQYIHGETAAGVEQLVGSIVGVDADGQQERIEGSLHDPGGGEGVFPLTVGYPNDVNAQAKPAKQGNHTVPFGGAQGRTPRPVIGDGNRCRWSAPWDSAVSSQADRRRSPYLPAPSGRAQNHTALAPDRNKASPAPASCRERRRSSW